MKTKKKNTLKEKRKTKLHKLKLCGKNSSEIVKKSEKKQDGKNSVILCVSEDNINKDKVPIILQEVKFARALASNDKKIRYKMLKGLKKWIACRLKSNFEFTESDFMRIWKGLFYCMWMSDKPLVQEELAESLSMLVHSFTSLEVFLLYTKCTLKTLSSEWFGIDRYRLDKFQMLVRRILRQTLEMCKTQFWDSQWVEGIASIIEELLLDQKTCLGFKLHIIEIFMEELAKVSQGNLSELVVTEFIKPFIMALTSSNDKRQIEHIDKHVFRHLIIQSDVGMEYADKFEAWKIAGFPCYNIDEMELVELEEDKESKDLEDVEDLHSKDKPLDPRAGRVNVEIPPVPFNSHKISTLLRDNKFHKNSSTLSRKYIHKLIDKFNKLHEGKMPIGIKRIPKLDMHLINHQKAAIDLLKFDQELLTDSSKNYHQQKKRKRQMTNAVSMDIEEIAPLEELQFQTPFKSQVKILKNDFDSKKTKTFKNNSKKNAIINVEKISTNVIKTNKKTKQFEMKKYKKDLGMKVSESDTSSYKKSKKPGKSKKISKGYNKYSIVNHLNAIKFHENKWNIEDISPTVVLKRNIAFQKEAQPSKSCINKWSTKSNEMGKISTLKPVLTRLEEQKNTPIKKSALMKSPRTDSTKKRVKIVEKNNTEHHTTEYLRQLRQSPAIPFDADRKPKVGVLKPCLLPSPINPFYKRKSM